MLAGKLALHDVRDCEALCVRIVQRSSLEPLPWHEREDLVAFLIAEAWTLSVQYRPGSVAFSTLATTTLQRRVVDWRRKKLGRTKWKFKGRTYERRRPQLVFSLDAPDVEHALTSGAGDPPAGGDADLAGLVDERRRSRSRDLEALGLEAPRRAAA
jgi:hypothetical protein